MCLYDGQFMNKIPTLRTGVAVEEADDVVLIPEDIITMNSSDFAPQTLWTLT